VRALPDYPSPWRDPCDLLEQTAQATAGLINSHKKAQKAQNAIKEKLFEPFAFFCGN
jgi:hypothetical protein